MNSETGRKLHFVLIKESIDRKLPMLDDYSLSAGSEFRMIEPVDCESIFIDILVNLSHFPFQNCLILFFLFTSLLPTSVENVLQHIIVSFFEFSTYFMYITEFELSYFCSHDVYVSIEIGFSHEISHSLAKEIYITSDIVFQGVFSSLENHFLFLSKC